MGNGYWTGKLSTLSTEAMERTTYVTKSFLIALALVKRHLTAEQAALAARVEVASQIERWGEVEDCEFQPSCRGLKFAFASLTLESSLTNSFTQLMM